MKPTAAENMRLSTLFVVCLFGAGCWALFFWMIWFAWRWIQG